MCFDAGVTPHFFQAVEFTLLRQHDMYHDVYIVHQYPLQGLGTFSLVHIFACGFFYPVFDIIGYRLYLWRTGNFTYDEKIGYGFRDLPQIKGNDVFPFFFPDCGNNSLEKFRISCKPGCT